VQALLATGVKVCLALEQYHSYRMNITPNIIPSTLCHSAAPSTGPVVIQFWDILTHLTPILRPSLRTRCSLHMRYCVKSCTRGGLPSKPCQDRLRTRQQAPPCTLSPLVLLKRQAAWGTSLDPAHARLVAVPLALPPTHPHPHADYDLHPACPTLAYCSISTCPAHRPISPLYRRAQNKLPLCPARLRVFVVLLAAL
jgi:hypothetical protein